MGSWVQIPFPPPVKTPPHAPTHVSAWQGQIWLPNSAVSSVNQALLQLACSRVQDNNIYGSAAGAIKHDRMKLGLLIRRKAGQRGLILSMDFQLVNPALTVGDSTGHWPNPDPIHSSAGNAMITTKLGAVDSLYFRPRRARGPECFLDWRCLAGLRGC